MSVQVIANSGPLGWAYLDDMRAEALGALDGAPDGSVPEALLRYIRALETEYLNRRHQQSRASLDMLWEPRRAKFTKEAGEP